jgi:uncharacterized membrane protein
VKTTEDINNEYSKLCAKLGDLRIKRGTLKHQENEIIKEIARLSKEMQAIKEKQGETEQ